MNEPVSPAQSEQHPLRRDIRSPRTGLYFGGYLLLGCAAGIIIIETLRTGLWVRLGAPSLMILLALLCFTAARKNERLAADSTRR